MGGKISVEDQARQWYLRLQEGVDDDQVRGEFERWLKADERHFASFKKVAVFWGTIEDLPDLISCGAAARQKEPDPDLFLKLANANETDQAIQAGMAKQPAKEGARVVPVRWWKKRHRGWFFSDLQKKYAAAAAFLLVGVFSYYLYQSWMPEGTFRTGVGEQLTVTLDDGSVMRLNTNTRVREEYSEKLRKVRLLRGEASFEVSKDETRPFVVETDHGVIMAVGTSFNVYETSGKVEIIVLEGTVAVGQGQTLPHMQPLAVQEKIKQEKSRPRDRDMVLLSAGEKVYAYENKLGLVGRASQLELDKKTLWPQGKVIFRGQALAEVVEEMARYSNRKIIITDRRAKDMKMGGAFEIDDFDAFISAVEDAFPVKVIRITPLLTVIVEA
ncbi:FecR family protein [Luteithermobacter gelatinilyticus]|uniref:FecR family protein n=1 Tax=Luteithermobacter gelatinilyticus TaxID=2582913 RepID=UPI001106E202|nr:FecR domain-containing protein [Luteithermobacter gelatinilyticus]|tara:strand:- start:32686 stop:33843 length:1158 start_codon:yes stop_codon:yes gene_type:complete